MDLRLEVMYDRYNQLGVVAANGGVVDNLELLPSADPREASEAVERVLNAVRKKIYRELQIRAN